MRVLWGWLLAVPLAAGAGGLAIASPQFSATAGVKFSSPTPGSPTGLDVSASWSDPGGVNRVPKQVTKMRFVGHPGTKFDTAALPAAGHRTRTSRTSRSGRVRVRAGSGP